MKKLLMCLTILFSAFLFTNKIKAEELSDFCEYTSPCLTTEKVEQTLRGSEDYLVVIGDGETDYDKRIVMVPLNINDSSYYNVKNGSDNSLLLEVRGGRTYSVKWKFSNYNDTFDLSSSLTEYTIYGGSTGYVHLSKPTKSTTPNIYAYYSTLDLYDENGSLVFKAGLHNEDEEEIKENFVNGHIYINLNPLDESSNYYNNYQRALEYYNTNCQGMEYIFSNFNGEGYGENEIDLLCFNKGDMDIYLNYVENVYNSAITSLDVFTKKYISNDMKWITFIDGRDTPIIQTKLNTSITATHVTNNFVWKSSLPLKYSTESEHNVFKDVEYYDTIYINDIAYSNGDIVIDSEELELNIPTPSYDVTFHLNGGVITDSYESNIEKKQIIKEMENIFNANGILDKYNDVKKEWNKLFSEPKMEKIQDFYKKFLVDIDTQNKLDNIYVKLVNKEYLQPTIYTEDYTINLSKNIFEDYILNQSIAKTPMSFQGWYYDKNFTKKFEIKDELNTNIDLYAKWIYANVDDFLNNTTFNNYTFDTNYEYAVISLGNNTGEIYLGLDFMAHNLEVYKYLKNENIYNEIGALCLTPYYSKENKYYYLMDTSNLEEYEVLIIPKEKLKENYNFMLSTNAYVTYTNDLKDIVIKDENGNEIHTDLENIYNYYQDTLLNNENDLINIFKDLSNNKDNNVFSYFNQVWNYIKRSKLYTYFMILISGALIILIIKAASR